MMTCHDITDLKQITRRQIERIPVYTLHSTAPYVLEAIRESSGSVTCTIPDTEFNREELRKQRLPISTDITPVEKKDLMPALKECVTCGSHAFKDLGGKLKCKYCGNEY